MKATGIAKVDWPKSLYHRMTLPIIEHYMTYSTGERVFRLSLKGAQIEKGRGHLSTVIGENSLEITDLIIEPTDGEIINQLK